MDRRGTVLSHVGDGKAYVGNYFGLSHDGIRVAITITSATGRTGWILGTDPPSSKPLIRQRDNVHNDPVWSPDGRRINLSIGGCNPPRPYVLNLEGGTVSEPLLPVSKPQQATDWSRDGKFVLFSADHDERSGFDLWILPLTGSGKPFPFLKSPGTEGEARFSPDGNWIAYSSDESVRLEVYVRQFRPGVIGSVAGPAAPFSRGGGEPQALFELNGYVDTVDGERFLVCSPVEATQPAIELLDNWTAVLAQ